MIAAIDALVENYERVNHLPEDKYKVARELLKDTTPLQALNELVENLKGKDNTLSLYDEERIAIIETALKEAEKNKKAVETIVKKDVDLEYEIFKTKNYTDYLKKWKDYLLECEILTQEEYEIIKEVSKRERTN